MQRKKEPGEKIIQNESAKKLKTGGSKYNCSICGVTGHNKKGSKSKQIPKVPNIRFKPPVKEKSATHISGVNPRANTTAKKNCDDRSAVATRIYDMASSNNIVTQHTDGFSTVTRIYKK